MRDSTELWAAKAKVIGDRQMAQAQAESQAESKSRAHAPSTQAQVPSNQTPSSQNQISNAPSTLAPQHRSQNHAGKLAKPETQLPPVPASDLVDRRRALSTI